MTFLSLESNLLTGTIPEELYDLEELVDFYTSGNQFSSTPANPVSTLEPTEAETEHTNPIQTTQPCIDTTPEPVAVQDESIKKALESGVLRRNVKFDELPLSDSRNLALDWLLHDDEMLLDATDSNLRQRFILAMFSFEFGELFKSSVDWLSSNDECEWYGLVCGA